MTNEKYRSLPFFVRQALFLHWLHGFNPIGGLATRALLRALSPEVNDLWRDYEDVPEGL